MDSSRNKIMKIPKDLRKKKNLENKTELLKKEIIKSFKVEFRRIKRKINDKRRESFKKIEEKGKYSNKLDRDIELKDYVFTYWDGDLIEIYLNYKFINQDIFNNPYFATNFIQIKVDRKNM